MAAALQLPVRRSKRRKECVGFGFGIVRPRLLHLLTMDRGKPELNNDFRLNRLSDGPEIHFYQKSKIPSDFMLIWVVQSPAQK